jgi:hypothetical protein
MGDVTTFPSIQDVLVSGDNIREFTATEAITKGQVVGFAATGVANAVVRMHETADEHPIGVAISTAAIGAIVKVAMAGCEVKVANSTDDTAIEAGEYVQTDDAAALGTVAVFTPRADLTATITDTVDDTVADSSANIIGVAQTIITADGTGTILLIPALMLYSDTAIV